MAWFVLHAGTVGSLKRDFAKKTFEVDDEDLDGLEEAARFKVIDDVAQEVLWDLIAWDWEPA